jgi:DNA polymerase-3 subunit alpha
MAVTHIDPIEFDLLFERFYNAGRNTAERVSLPDIDMDFEIKQRSKVIEYIRERYGKDRVAQMLTFTRLQGRGALKDVFRAHAACSYDEMNLITKNIPDEAEISDQLQAMKELDKKAGGDGEASIIQWALENNAAELKQWAFLDDDGKMQGPFAKYFEQAIRIEGTKKSQSKHAAGIVIAQQPLAEVCPMVYDKSTQEMICGLEMNDLESMGHVKFDILGIAMLDKVHGILNLLRTGELDG